MPLPHLAIYAAAFGGLAACEAPPRFFDAALVASQYDPANAATRVEVRFEVRDGHHLPIGDLTAADFTIREDGTLATAESNLRLEETKHSIRVAILLDRSASVRDGEVLEEMQSAARSLLEQLAQYPCEVRLYTFASSVEPLDALDDFATSAREDGNSRWTALYHAINTVMNESALGQPTANVAHEPTAELAKDGLPQCILVVCTDGADNYSQNFASPTLTDLQQFIAKSRVVIHSLGFGNVEHEQDRQGIFGAAALRRLAVHGSFHHASDPTAVASIAHHIGRRIRATYSCVFYSPSLEGDHDLTLDVRWQERTGRSKPIRFRAGTAEPTAAPPSR